VAEILLELPALAVGKSVHRVDHNGLDTSPRAPAQNVIDDGDDVGEALTRPSTCGEDVIVPATSCAYGLGLVLVEPHGLSFAALLRFYLEDFPTLLVEHTLLDHLVDPLTRLECWV
jgi:hypothetical protein